MGNKKTTEPIDFVITWVDGNDPAWQRRKTQYTGKGETEGNTVARYRDWDTLRYWFRGVEKFAPWVNHIYLVTDRQTPEWLNTAHPGVTVVDHTQMIPEEYLPTFNANTIEWNMHRIQGLSEHFVYFNDDIFVINHTQPEDFFVNGHPCDCPNIGPLYASGFFSQMLFNNLQVINRHFSLHESIRKHFGKWICHQTLKGLFKMALYGRKSWVPGIDNAHLHACLNKKYFDVLWEKEREVIDNTCRSRLREREDVTSWLVRDWQLFSGDFVPRRVIGRMFHTGTMFGEAMNYLRGQKGKVICLNDSEDENDFETHKKQALETFEMILGEKSAYEK